MFLFPNESIHTHSLSFICTFLLATLRGPFAILGKSGRNSLENAGLLFSINVVGVDRCAKLLYNLYWSI